jgi:sigma-B regulation protein RsbU (phosphoserine phosphatase)
VAVDPAAILSAAKSFRIVDVVAALNGNCAGAGTAAFCPGSEKTESAWEKRDGHADRTVNRRKRSAAAADPPWPGNIFRVASFVRIIRSTMETQILLPPGDAPKKKFWKPWKWIGLLTYAAVLLLNRWLPGPLVAAGYLYGIAVVAHLLFHAFRYLKDRLFWRVRNRIIGSFIFVGIIPIVLLLGVVFLSAFLLAGQLADRYLEISLRESEHQITEINEELMGLIGGDLKTALPAMASRVWPVHSGQFPGLASRLLRRQTDGSFVVMSKYDPRNTLREPKTYPGDKWLAGGAHYEGLIRQGEIALMTSLRPVPRSAGLYLEVSAPLDQSVEERLQREKSIYFTLLGVGKSHVVVSNRGVRIVLDDPEQGGKSNEPQVEEQFRDQLSALEARRQSDKRLMVSWGLPLRCKDYETGKEEYAGVAVLHVPLETIYDVSFGPGDTQEKFILIAIYSLAGMFVFVEIVSLIIGLTINRRITRSVHDMYQGTLALQKGNLQHRIPVRRKDQLGLLAHSFNQMSTSISRLLEEVSEKKRLEQELEIAREVQATLFPKQLPRPRGMAVFGGCEPARVVSGDYYDFIVEDEAHLDIVVADISGKGISAALLIANLQAVMRNQLLAIKHDDPENIAKSLASVVAQLNQQIYVYSPSEKYATLFLSRYDAESRRLWYCNAGHLPPILLSARGTQLLEATGTVVGLLPGTSYEARSIELTPGSMLAIFTDGITEAVNHADEEFGDERLREALQQASQRTPEEIYKFVISRVRDWQGNLPQHDDMTLIVAKVG